MTPDEELVVVFHGSGTLHTHHGLPFQSLGHQDDCLLCILNQDSGMGFREAVSGAMEGNGQPESWAQVGV